MSKLEFLNLIHQWGVDRNIIGTGGTVQGQLYKLFEEFGELSKALAKKDKAGIVDGIGDVAVVAVMIAGLLGTEVQKLVDDSHYWERLEHTHSEMSSSLAWISRAALEGNPEIIRYFENLFEELSQLANQEGLTFEACLEAAWNEIKDRKGIMFNGVFVKESDERYPEIMAELGRS